MPEVMWTTDFFQKYEKSSLNDRLAIQRAATIMWQTGVISDEMMVEFDRMCDAALEATS